eukprot:NODE_6248_length_557_cov_5.402326_g6083_i0.p1 GENE.NODE_6248_length_557_cov_5.402326_g6083_i0~~NODE_6248_length_557_cov_5.402326_g6083_i0.p1  ORF type:complete len:124 (-),score=6.58 NODE_6248_length_557_cov_5.402326_g6083_i0:126-497(-)
MEPPVLLPGSFTGQPLSPVGSFSSQGSFLTPLSTNSFTSPSASQTMESSPVRTICFSHSPPTCILVSPFAERQQCLGIPEHPPKPYCHSHLPQVRWIDHNPQPLLAPAGALFARRRSAPAVLL